MKTIAYISMVLVIALIFAGCKKDKTPSASGDAGVSAAKETVSSHGTLVNINPQQLAMRSWYGKKAPSFAVTDIAGKSHRLSDYANKSVIVVYWATWCPPCRKEIPHFNELTAENPDVKVIGLTFEKPSVVKGFMDKTKMDYTVACVTEDQLPAPYNGIRAFPTMFFISKSGNFKAIVEGGLGYSTLKDLTSK